MDWVLVGLGRYRGAVDVEIRWLDGKVETLRGLAPGRYHDVRYGAQLSSTDVGARLDEEPR